MTARREFLLIAIATLITVITWAALNTFHNLAKTDVSPKWQDAAEPLDPNFDLEGLQVK